jgi:hypothetical protein
MPIIREMEMEVMGECFRVQIYRRENGTYFALTRFSDVDAIISDGRTIDEVLERHAGSLPMAIDSRRSRKRLLEANEVRKG